MHPTGLMLTVGLVLVSAAGGTGNCWGLLSTAPLIPIGCSCTLVTGLFDHGGSWTGVVRISSGNRRFGDFIVYDGGCFVVAFAGGVGGAAKFIGGHIGGGGVGGAIFAGGGSII